MDQYEIAGLLLRHAPTVVDEEWFCALCGRDGNEMIAESCKPRDDSSRMTGILDALGAPATDANLDALRGEIGYECECCEQMTCTAKKPGIGYVCDPCMAHWEEDFGSCRRQ